MKRLFCLGLGYSALALARRLEAQGGWTIQGTATSAGGAARLEAMGFQSFVFDGAGPEPGVRRALAAATHILASIPPGASGDPALRHHARDIARAEGLAWIGYLSTIGVYGDRHGEWVDETAEPRPSSERSVQRLATENDWLALGRAPARRVEIFRLSGIYGPGRSAVDSLRAGTARTIVKPGQVFNRVHVEDIAGVLEAAIERGGGHAVYNVADDEPASPQEVNAYAANLLGLPPPPEIPFGAAEMSEMARSFYAANKRVRNDRIKTSLGAALRFPTYREGLSAIAGVHR